MSNSALLNWGSARVSRLNQRAVLLERSDVHLSRICKFLRVVCAVYGKCLLVMDGTSPKSLLLETESPDQLEQARFYTESPKDFRNVANRHPFAKMLGDDLGSLCMLSWQDQVHCPLFLANCSHNRLRAS